MRYAFAIIAILIPSLAHALPEQYFVDADSRVYDEVEPARPMKSEILGFDVYEYELNDCNPVNLTCSARIGFLATDFEAGIGSAFPSFTWGNEIDEYCEAGVCVPKKINYDNNQLVAVLTKGLQEVFAESASLETRLDASELDIASLETAISNIPSASWPVSGTPSTFTPSAHTHSASDITNGTFADARISQSNVTQHQSALSVSSSQVSGTKTSSYISDFNSAVDARIPSVVPRSFSSATGRSISNAAFQVSSTRDALVSYSVNTSTTATIGGASSVTIVLEISPTSGGTYTEIARFSNSQTITLAVVLQSVQINSGVLTGVIPAGYYAKLRVLSSSGTQSSSFQGGQEVLL